VKNPTRALTSAAAGWILAAASMAAFAQHYTQTNLASDLANVDGKAVPVQDTSLRNTWGLARAASSPWWVNNADTGTAVLFMGTGGIVTPPSPIVIPNAPGAKGASIPTGMVFNGTMDFMIRNVAGKKPAPALFIFATENGTISAWNPAVTPLQMAVNQVSEKGANFTGLTWIANSGTHWLLAANFAQNRVEAFDANFKRVTLPAGAFSDTSIPAGFAPYNVQAVGANVVVTYAHQNVEKTDADQNCGEQCGFVDVYSIQGHVLLRLQHLAGRLNGPWGIALAPRDFGFFSHALLIGNRFSGRIDAFNFANGGYLGNLLAANGSAISIPGLWGLEFDNRGPNQASPSPGPALFFAAGINGYADGLIGTLTPVAAELTAEDHQ
jgi:uncharacterized protein (TIGR03118 family)